MEDDYISQIKEMKEESFTCFTFPTIDIRLPQRQVILFDKELNLTAKEFNLLCFLAQHPGWVFTREQIYEAVWDDIPVSVDTKVECMIYSIRKKIRKYTEREYIRTVWGVGYKFDPET